MVILFGYTSLKIICMVVVIHHIDFVNVEVHQLVLYIITHHSLKFLLNMFSLHRQDCQNNKNLAKEWGWGTPSRTSIHKFYQNYWRSFRSWCSFSMMVKWANYGTLQANDGKILVNDGEMPVNDGEMMVWSYTHLTIINKQFIIINKHFTFSSLK